VIGRFIWPSCFTDRMFHQFVALGNVHCNLFLNCLQNLMLHLLILMQGNATYTRLKRIFVADGIALKVIGAQKVSVTHPHSIGLLSNGSLLTSNNDLSQIWPLSYSTCAPLLQVGVVGSVIIVVHQTSVSGGHVKTFSRSHDTIELLSDKCKINIANRLISEFLFASLAQD